MKKTFVSAFLSSFAVILVFGSEAIFAADALPNPNPPFEVLKGERQTPILKVGQFEWDGKIYSQPSLCVAGKHIGVREVYKRGNSDESIGIVVDNRQTLNFQFWGGYKQTGGIPFQVKEGTTPELKIDEAAQTITYSKQYLLPDGETATYSHTLKPLTDSQVELSWTLGISQEKLNSLPTDFTGVSLWISTSVEGAHSGIFQVNGVPLRISPKEKLTQSDNSLMNGEGLDLVYNPDKPLQSFSFKLPETFTFNAAENQNGLIIRTGPKERQAQGKLIIDLGLAPEKDAAAPPPVAGIDFWQNDAIDVPASSTRNLMPNPSFEQGLRFWKWWPNGANFVPAETPKYSVTNETQWGGSALHIREGEGCPMLGFPIPLIKGKTYTLSFYAKAEKPGSSINVGIMSPVKGSEFTWMKALNTNHKISTDWERYTYTFVADVTGASVAMHTYNGVWVDAIQLEEGDQATDFVAPDVEGRLVTSDPDNALATGAPINAALALSGKPGVSGEAELNLFNYYRENLFSGKLPFTLDKDGAARLELPLDAKKLGTGVFVLQARYHVGTAAPIRDYYRLSIMDFLENKHATKDLFGSLAEITQIPRGDDLGRAYMRWGFGSKTYGVTNQEKADLLAKYRITDYLVIASEMGTPEQNKLLEGPAKEWGEVPPGGEKLIEDTVYNVVKANPWQKSWAFTTETEGKSPMLIKGKADEWAKVLAAFHRGVKRADPTAIVLPDGGTSGFSRLRGYRETEAYFANTKDIKWDAIATHPYGTVDDMDVVSDLLIEMMQKYGYGKETPIDYTEGFNITETWLPEWGDDGCYDNYQGGKPSYDFGWKEYLQAAQASRIFITCLKYWPQVRSFNIWVSRPYMDQYLTPLALCKVPNTLGHLFGKPKFVADLRPAAGVRGYVFEDEDGRGLAAIWTNLPRVEQGADRGPVMQVKFDGEIPEFIDLMGNARPVQAKSGVVSIQLTPAPLFLRSAKGGAAELAAALDRGQVAGAGSSLKLDVLPTVEGTLQTSIANLTNRPMSGTLALGENQLAVEVPAQQTLLSALPETYEQTPGKLNSWKEALTLKLASGIEEKTNFDLAFFYVPRATTPLPLDPAAPEWQNIPAIPLTNGVAIKSGGTAPTSASDLDGKFQLAWDKDNLYLRVSVVDDKFIPTAADHWKTDPSKDRQLYLNDGSVEVFFDTGANGRSNLVKGYDADDYRYDFSAGNANGESGPTSIYRFKEPYHQLAGGIDMPTKADAAKGVQSQFQRTADGYAYVMIFPQKFIEPLKLEKGWQAGFSLFLPDNDDGASAEPTKGLSLTTQPGAISDNQPDLWPILILSE